MQRMQETAKILGVSEENGKIILELDQTIFYPQGGGQPYDQGVIENASEVFNVEEVRYVEGIVKHIGTGYSFQVGEEVTLKVDESRRKLHMRLHSGGHLLDMAINKIGLGWKPAAR